MTTSFSRLVRFVLERFPLYESVPFLLAFSLAVQGVSVTGFHWILFLKIFTLIFLFFLRLRIFDELKDEQFDKIHNPQRPLARGLVTRNEVMSLLLSVAIGELILFLVWFKDFLFLYLLPFGYSFLMFKEFFCGAWLRPKLTTYAVTHTFVVAILVYVWTSILGKSDFFNKAFYSVGFWMLFNLYEFARKTWTAEEEVDGVDSYSKVWGPKGAVFLIWLCAIIFNATMLAHPLFNTFLPFFLGNTLLVILSGILYLFGRWRNRGKIFRLVSGVYIILNLLILSGGGFLA